MNKKILAVIIAWTGIYAVLAVIFASFGFLGKNYTKADAGAPTQIKTENNTSLGKEISLKRGDKIEKMPLETYICGVTAAEMPASFETEALKAQAVAARTYTYSKMNKNIPEHGGADVCDNINHCKAYLSEEELKSKHGEQWMNEYYPKIKNAVSETAGIIATYDGEPITAVFHSTSSGMTENSKDVWNGDVPYLVSVKSEGEEESPRYTDTAVFSLSDFKNKILSIGNNAVFSDNPQEWVGEITHNESGSVNTIVIGGVPFKGTQIRTALGLRSTNFEIAVADSVKITTKGNGHGVGMSQYGANHMAKLGYTYEQILKKYYTGIKIEKSN